MIKEALVHEKHDGRLDNTRSLGLIVPIFVETVGRLAHHERWWLSKPKPKSDIPNPRGAR